MFRGLRRTVQAILTLALILTFPLQRLPLTPAFPMCQKRHRIMIALSISQNGKSSQGLASASSPRTPPLPFGNGRSCSAEPMASK